MIRPESEEVQYDGVHGKLVIQQFSRAVVVLRISGSDVGEFGEAPLRTLDRWLASSGQIEFFIDARDGRGVSIDVSAEWACWMSTNKARFHTVTMLTGSAFVHITAEFVRKFAALEDIMRICTQPAVFDSVLAQVLDVQ